jgi:hypothetical protein
MDLQHYGTLFIIIVIIVIILTYFGLEVSAAVIFILAVARPVIQIITVFNPNAYKI